MTLNRLLRLKVKIYNHAKARNIPDDLIPLLSNSFLEWLDRYPKTTGPHLDRCLEAFVQGWIKGSLDFRIGQELTRQETAQN